jgi:tyrosine-protein phosphatase SIW14
MLVRLSIARALVMIVCALAATGAAGQTAEHPKKKIATLLPGKGIPKFGEVTPRLYRGGQPTEKGFAVLKKMGVHIIVDMRSGNRDAEKEMVTKLGMEYVHISWHCPFPTDKPFARFLKIIEDNPDQKIFVHCRLGDDRTGMAIASYRMAEQGWSADDAMNEMHDFGFSGAHHLICPSLAGYEKSFPERLKKSEAFKDLRGPKETKK